MKNPLGALRVRVYEAVFLKRMMSLRIGYPPVSPLDNRVDAASFFLLIN